MLTDKLKTDKSKEEGTYDRRRAGRSFGRITNRREAERPPFIVR